MQAESNEISAETADSSCFYLLSKGYAGRCKVVVLSVSLPLVWDLSPCATAVGFFFLHRLMPRRIEVRDLVGMVMLRHWCPMIIEFNFEQS
jgi:hypothetical protein